MLYSVFAGSNPDALTGKFKKGFMLSLISPFLLICRRIKCDGILLFARFVRKKLTTCLHLKLPALSAFI